MVRSEEVKHLNRFKDCTPHFGGFVFLIRKENFEQAPHLPRSRSWGWA